MCNICEKHKIAYDILVKNRDSLLFGVSVNSTLTSSILFKFKINKYLKIDLHILSIISIDDI